MQLMLALLRLAQFATAMVLLGSPAFALAFAPRLREPRAFDAGLRRLLLCAAAAALLTAVLWLDLEAAIMGGGWGQALDPSTLGTVLFATEFGGTWQWHLGLGGALLAALLPRSQRLLPVETLLGAAFVTSLAWAGHAVMQPGPTQVGLMAMHLLAAGLWLGSLPALFLALRLARSSREVAERLIELLPLYSRAGYFVVALVLFTGIANSLFLVDSLGALAATWYGRVLLAKVALVLVMIGIAATNRFRLLPAILAASAGHATMPLGALLRSVALEQGAAVLVLAAVSWLGTLPPALNP